MHANKTNGTKEFMPVMGQKLNLQIASPNQRVFHSECLYLTRIPRFINPKFLPLVEFRRIPIRDTDPERMEDGTEELIVGENHRVD